VASIAKAATHRRADAIRRKARAEIESSEEAIISARAEQISSDADLVAIRRRALDDEIEWHRSRIEGCKILLTLPD